MPPKKGKGEVVNAMKIEEVDDIWKKVLRKGWVVRVKKGAKVKAMVGGTEVEKICQVEYDYVRKVKGWTKTRAGGQKYIQVPIKRGGQTVYVLLHHLYYRHETRETIPRDMEVSHLHKSPRVLMVSLETPYMNRTRSYCHLFNIGVGGEGTCKHTPKCLSYELEETTGVLYEMSDVKLVKIKKPKVFKIKKPKVKMPKVKVISPSTQ